MSLNNYGRKSERAAEFYRDTAFLRHQLWGAAAQPQGSGNLHSDVHNPDKADKLFCIVFYEFFEKPLAS